LTGPEFRAARKALGLSQHGMADALHMGRHGWQSISRWERGIHEIPGPVQKAVEMMLEKVHATPKSPSKVQS